MSAPHDNRIQILGEPNTAISALLEDPGFQVGLHAGTIWVTPDSAQQLSDDHHHPAALTVFQPPIQTSDFERALRAARTSNTSVRIADPTRRLAAAENFVSAACALRQLSPITAVRAETDPDRLYSLLHVLSDALGRIRPGKYDPATNTSSATIAGAPMKIELRESRPARITVISDAGDLTLIGDYGPVVWQPTAGAAELIGPIPAATDPVADLRAAVQAELKATETTARALSRAQQEVSLCRLVDALAGTGSRQHASDDSADPTSARPLHAADLFAPPSPDIFTAPFARLARHAAHEAGIAATDPGQLASLQQATAVTDRYSRAAMHRLIRSALPAASAANVVAALDTSARHAWLVRRWLAALLDSGELYEDDHGTLSAGAEPADVSEAELATAYRDLGFNPLMVQLHTAIASRLDDLIRDKLRIEEILFTNQDVVPALAAYQDNVVSRYLNAALADAVSGVAPATSPAGPLKLIELGAGAGVCAAAVLNVLQGQPVDYLFTDVSPTLLASAQQRFRGKVRVELLDINADLIDQGCGLRPGSADVVIAANVLHNAAHVGRSLRRIRRVLRPGGLLAVVESTRDSHAVLTSMAFLLSPAAGDRATDDVFLDRQSWRREMAGAGFAVAFDLPEQHSPLALSGQHLILGVAL